MHLVILHGYLLRGTGSNVYTANVAETWKNQGHAVTVVCQDHLARTLPFVDELIVGTDKIPSTPPANGTIRVVVPDIGGLLLVYNYDRYEGFEVKTMRECSLKEIDAHIELTVKGLKRVLAQGVDRILTNHTILSPVIASRACQDTTIPYDVKIHGSSITFSIKPRPELKHYAIEGLRSCHKIVVGSTYSKKLLMETLSEESQSLRLEQKSVLIPCGMNPSVFKLADGIFKNQTRFLANIKTFIQKRPNGRKAQSVTLPLFSSPSLQQDLTTLANTYDQNAVDADLLERWITIKEGEPVICYFGKFLNTKGVGEIVASIPSILVKVPNIRVILVGFGCYREHMEGMLSAMKSGDVEAFKAYASAGDFVDNISDTLLKKIFRKLSDEEFNRITITGILEHEQLCEILPLASISVVASKAPEAFGMVSIEAMAAGVLPLCNRHTGLADVLQCVEEIEPELGSLMGIDTCPGGVHDAADGAFFIEKLPAKVESALAYLYPNGFQDDSRRKEISQKLREIAVLHFSWDGIGKRLTEELSY